MPYVERVEAWVESHRSLLESAGPIVLKKFLFDNYKPSVQFLVQAPTEPELMVWESGEVEFGILHADGTVSERHFDLTQPDDLDPLFDEVLSLLGLEAAQ